MTPEPEDALSIILVYKWHPRLAKDSLVEQGRESSTMRLNTWRRDALASSAVAR